MLIQIFFFLSYFAFPQHLSALTSDKRRLVFLCPQAAGPTPWLGTKLLLQHFFEWSWAKAEGSRQFLSPAGSSASSRREKQHCGEASADDWRILAKLRCFNNRWWGKGLASSLSIILQRRRSLHMTSCAVVSDLLLNGPRSASAPLPSSRDGLMVLGFDFHAGMSGGAIPPLRGSQGGNI